MHTLTPNLHCCSLRIWQLRPSDECILSTVLPADDATTQRPKPWLLHTLPVNTLNFCSFSMCNEHKAQDIEFSSVAKTVNATALSSDSILVATPSTDDKKINVYQFPEEKLRYVVPKATSSDTGKYLVLSQFLFALDA